MKKGREAFYVQKCGSKVPRVWPKLCVLYLLFLRELFLDNFEKCNEIIYIYQDDLKDQEDQNDQVDQQGQDEQMSVLKINFVLSKWINFGKSEWRKKRGES